MIRVDGGRIGLDALYLVAAQAEPVELSREAAARMQRSRETIERIVESGETVYGVNTGFGRLADERFTDPDDLRKLQVNLVRSHACGVMEPLAVEQVRAMMLLRANVLALGYSGARPILAERIVEMLNAGVHPVVPSRGSVGASGDLAPLAHLTLALIGEGECLAGAGSRVPSAVALQDAGIEPVSLEAKEGLALLNGTQAMCAVGGLALWRARACLGAATTAAALSTDALLGTDAALDERIHSARPHPGQARIAADMRACLEGSEVRASHKSGDSRVQDAYSLRCAPQVHGAVLDTIELVAARLEVESASATDNPLVFENGDVVSGGNFHGAPIAHALDFAKIALADLASISERRIERLVNPDLSEGLPAFLAERPGLESGLMIAQVAAAALLAECRALAAPASVDSIPTSGGKEDHVSMGMGAALTLQRMVELAARVVAIELIAATEGLRRRAPLRPSEPCASAMRAIGEFAAPLTADRSLSAEIEAVALHVLSGKM